MTAEMKQIVALVGLLALIFFLFCISAHYFSDAATNKITCPHCHEEIIITP